MRKKGDEQKGGAGERKREKERKKESKESERDKDGTDMESSNDHEKYISAFQQLRPVFSKIFVARVSSLSRLLI